MAPSISYAGFWRRTLALLIDLLVLGPLTVLYWVLFAASPGAAIFAIVGVGIFPIVYPIVFHARWGQTIGKMVTKIRVVRVDGMPIGVRQASLRSSVDVLLWLVFASLMVWTLATWGDSAWSSLGWTERWRVLGDRNRFYVSYTWVSEAWMWSEVVVLLFNRRRRALHDFIAGTLVVRLGPDVQQVSLPPQPALETR